MKRVFILLVLYSALLAGETCRSDKAEVISLDTLPPSVVRTIPQCGDVDVDPTTTTQIKVLFSKNMADGSWSWSRMSEETFPGIEGNPRYLSDKRTCIVDVKLEPKKTYVIWINSDKFQNFKDLDGRPAIPYLLVFQTK